MRLAKRTAVKVVILAILVSGLFAGCGGGAAEVKQSSTTMGQQLTDLKAAYDQGIITEREYERAKEKILNGCR